MLIKSFTNNTYEGMICYEDKSIYGDIDHMYNSLQKIKKYKLDPSDHCISGCIIFNKKTRFGIAYRNPNNRLLQRGMNIDKDEVIFIDLRVNEIDGKLVIKQVDIKDDQDIIETKLKTLKGEDEGSRVVALLSMIQADFLNNFSDIDVGEVIENYFNHMKQYVITLLQENIIKNPSDEVASMRLQTLKSM